MNQIFINEEWCKHCYICVELCPKNVFSKGNKVSKKGGLLVEITNLEACSGCLQCEMLCPDLAIHVIKKAEG